MKIPTSFIAFFLFCLQTSFCQTLHIDSTRFITGDHWPGTNIDFAIPTSDKGILFTGYAYQYSGGIIPASSYAGENVMVGKIDSNHQISWIKVYGGNGDDGGECICQTADGGYGVLARTLSNDGDVTGYKGNGDILLLRLDATGNLLWGKCYGSSQSDGPVSIAYSTDHGFILLGLTIGADGDVPFHYGSLLSFDWLVVKTDSAGNVQWSKDIGGTGGEGLGSILSAGNGYYLAGASDSKDYDCIDTAWHAHVNTLSDFHLLKLDSSGTVLWDSSYGGSGSDGPNYAMHDGRDNSIVMTGTTTSNDYMISGNSSDQAIWVIKVAADGTLLWKKTLDTTSYMQWGTSVCADYGTGYVTYGWMFTSAGIRDLWIVALDGTGNRTTQKFFGGQAGTGQSSTSIVRYGRGYAAVGLSDADSFTEGTTYGNFTNGGPFISYIDTGARLIADMVKENTQINVCPNPVKEKFVISILQQTYNNFRVEITDIVGRQIYKGTIPGNADRLTVPVYGWEKGMYYVRVSGDAGYSCVKKIVVE